jgi:Protein of unknown function (DUF736)
MRSSEHQALLALGRARRAEGEEVNSPAGGDGTQRPPSENDEYAPDEYVLPPAANRLLRPRRSYVASIIIFIVFGVVALLVAIGISRLGPIERRPILQSEAPPPPPQPERFSEQPVEPIEPFKSLVLDTAQSYLATGSLPMATMPIAKSDREYLSVKLDDPSFPAPIYASLVKGEGDDSFTLIWSRRTAE